MSKQFNSREPNTPGVTTDQTDTQSAACRLCNSREKHHRLTNCHPTRSPFCAENFQIDVCRRALGLLLENSCKPPFSLGLQCFLELLLHKIRVPGVSHRVH